MKLRYVFLIAALCFIAGMGVSALFIGGPLFIKLLEARTDLEHARADAEQVLVLVARDRFSQWSTIRDPANMFDVQTTRKRLVAPNAIVLEQPGLIDTLKGRRFRATIDPGHILTEDDLLKKEVSGIDSMLEKGKRAMAIPISADQAVAFFVVPGCKVDVLQTVDGKSTVLLENVLVLAIDLSTARAEDRVQTPATATLQLDNTEQVLKLTGARDKGVLSLVMRPPGDDDDKGAPREAAATAV